jgi:hypothetical protein
MRDIEKSPQSKHRKKLMKLMSSKKNLSSLTKLYTTESIIQSCCAKTPPYTQLKQVTASNAEVGGGGTVNTKQTPQNLSPNSKQSFVENLGKTNSAEYTGKRLLRDVSAE